MKDKKNSKIKMFEIVLVGVVFIILGLILFTNEDQNIKAHCKKAVCNSDNTICYNYSINSDGKTIKTWEGSCVK